MTKTEKPGNYVALVRKYHPQGWDHSYWAGSTKREGGKRVTDLCAHQHSSHEEAQTCADYLVSLRIKP